MSVSIPNLAADFETSLNTSVSDGDTTASLVSNLDADGVALADGLYAFTIDNDTDYKEYIVGNLATTSISNIYHISRQGALTAGFSNYHRRGASVQITDWAILYRLMANLTGAINLNSAVPLQYDATATISSPNMLATKAYVDSVVNGGTVAFDTQVLSGQTAGENLTAGDLVYFKTSDQRWWKTDADTSSTVIGVRLGIANATVTTGNALQIVISGPYTTSGLTAGSKYYASQTTGAITATAPTAPAFPAFVGWALSTTKLLFNPASTIDQFSGNSGTPSSTNRFLTELSTSVSGTDQSQTTQNGTSPVGQANTTGARAKLAQSFIPTKTQIKGVNLYKSANTGTFTGTVTISIQADSAGAPSGSALATKTITNTLYNAYSTGDFLALFSSETSVTPGNTYWIVIETSTTDTSNCINIGTNTAGGYANGSVKFNNSTDGWIAVATIDLYFKTIEGSAGKEIVGDSSGLIAATVRKILSKSTTYTGFSSGNATIVHGFGRIPSFIRGNLTQALSATSTVSISSYGFYDVSTSTSSGVYVKYGDTSGNNAGTTTFLGYDISANVPSHSFTIIAVDENIVIVNASNNSSGPLMASVEIIG